MHGTTNIMYFIVYIASSQNVTPHKLNTNCCATEFTTVLSRWTGYTRTRNPANPPPIPECQFDHSLYVYSKPNLWPLGLHTRPHYPPGDYNTALMLPPNFPSFTKARHSALSLPSYIQSTPRFFNIHSLPQLKSWVHFSLIYYFAPSIASLQ